MMSNDLPIQLVTFDLYDTLIELVPPRWERLVKALRSLGIEADDEALKQGDLAGEDYWTEMNTLHPMRDRPDEERGRIRDEFIRRWLAVAGIEVSDTEATVIRHAYRAEYEQPAHAAIPGLIDGYRTFGDVNRTMQRLREAGVLTAVISNADADVTEFCTRLQFAHEMDLIVTSALIGYEKPDVRTFRAALDPLGIDASRALHIGDQPRSDVVGALATGMRAPLIDRYARHRADDHTVPVFLTLDSLVDHVLTVNKQVESVR